MGIKYNFLLPNSVEKKIIIVGAGIAGLFCANELQKHGFLNVLILEASDRIGGRINPCQIQMKPTADNNGKLILDTGPQRISRGSNSIYELASRYELLDKNRPDYCEALKTLDTVHSSKEEKIITDLVFYFAQFYYFPKCCEEILESRDFQIKFKQYDQSLIQKYARGVYDWHRSFVYEFSFLPADLKSYNELLKIIMKSIPYYWIAFNKEVVNIDWTEVMPKSAEAISETSKIKLRCRYGSGHYEADHVIITVPLGYLKQNADSLFVPPLPESKMNAIMSLDFITFNKIYLVFDEPFWKIPDVFHVIWNKTLEKLFCEDYESGQGPWVRGISHFEYVTESPLILLACVWNEGAEIMENVSVEKIIRDCRKLLEHLLQRTLPEAKAVLQSFWHSNPLFHGSLPFDPSRDAGDDILKIAESVLGGSSGTQPVLLFAGDATNKMDLACVHGAAATGVRAANEIHAYYKDAWIV